MTTEEKSTYYNVVNTDNFVRNGVVDLRTQHGFETLQSARDFIEDLFDIHRDFLGGKTYAEEMCLSRINCYIVEVRRTAHFDDSGQFLKAESTETRIN